MRVRATVLIAALVLAAPVASPAEAPADPPPTPAATPAGNGARLPTISTRNAADHVDQEVLLEGRVHAVHVSPLATVLALSPNFGGFTATIHAADLARFPKNVHETTRDRSVRLRGVIRTYRGRYEMRLEDPSQLVVLDPVEPPGGSSRAVADDVAEDLRAALARIETRLDDLERRLGALEDDALARAAEPEALGVGMPASAAEARLGPPLEELDDADGRRVWVYENGRTLTFDATARVVAWSGF